MGASHKPHRLHIKKGKDTEEEDYVASYPASIQQRVDHSGTDRVSGPYIPPRSDVCPEWPSPEIIH